MISTLSIIGAGGHGRVLADAAAESGRWQNIEFFDDRFTDSKLTGIWSIVGLLKNLIDLGPRGNREVIVGIGDNALRYALQNQFQAAGWKIATVIHPNATISRNCIIEPGVVVLAGAIINIGARIGAGSIINTQASIDHDCQLGLSVHISPGATITGTTNIGDRSWIGAGSIVLNNIQIGEDTIVGAGSTVIRDIQNNVVVVGTPARVIRKRAERTDNSRPEILLEVPG